MIDKKRFFLRHARKTVNAYIWVKQVRHRVTLCKFIDAFLNDHGKPFPEVTEDVFIDNLERLYFEKKEKIQDQVKLKEIEKVTKSTIEEQTKEWINVVSVRLNAKTVESYQATITHLLPVAGAVQVSRWTEKTELNFLQALKEKNQSDASILKHFRQLQAFFNWLYKTEVIQKPIKLNKPRATQKLPTILTINQEQMLFKAITQRLEESTPGYKQLYLNHLRLYWIAFRGLLRASEIHNLRLQDLDIENRLIYIREHENSQEFKIKGRQESTIPIVSDFYEFLLKDLVTRKTGEYWFLDRGNGTKAFADKRSMPNALKKYYDPLGITGIKPIHVARYTGATRLLEAGVDVGIVQRLLRHQDVSTTLRHYINTEAVGLREKMERLTLNT